MQKRLQEDPVERETPADPTQQGFYQSVAEVFHNAHANTCRAINFAMVEAYWNIGRMFVKEEQRGRDMASR